jgi:hypothetical protein
MFSDAEGLAGRLGNATVIGGAVPEEPIPSWRKGFQSGPEPSRARRQARAKRPFTARTALADFPLGGNGPVPQAMSSSFNPQEDQS